MRHMDRYRSELRVVARRWNFCWLCCVGGRTGSAEMKVCAAKLYIVPIVRVERERDRQTERSRKTPAQVGPATMGRAKGLGGGKVGAEAFDALRRRTAVALFDRVHKRRASLQERRGDGPDRAKGVALTGAPRMGQNEKGQPRRCLPRIPQLPVLAVTLAVERLDTAHARRAMTCTLCLADPCRERRYGFNHAGAESGGS